MTLGTAGANWAELMIFSIMIFAIMLRWLTPPTAAVAAVSEFFGSQLQLLRCHYSRPPRGSAASSRVLHCSFFTGASGYAFGYASGCASVYCHLVAVDFTADASYTMTLGTAGADWPGLMISIIMIFSMMIFVTMTRWLLVTCCGGCSQRVLWISTAATATTP